MPVLGNVYVSSMDGEYMGMVHGTEKGGRLDDAYGYLHRVVILFLVILCFMGVFLGGLSLRVFTLLLHTNFCSCMGLCLCFSFPVMGQLSVYIPSCFFSLGWAYLAVWSWEWVANHPFLVIYLLYRSCLYVQEGHEKHKYSHQMFFLRRRGWVLLLPVVYELLCPCLRH